MFLLLTLKASTKNAVSDAEKREKKLLERKLAEMEEELKVIVCRLNVYIVKHHAQNCTYFLPSSSG